MKKLLLATFCLVMCGLFTACNDDDEKVPNGPTITYAGKLPQTVSGYTFIYDGEGRCTEIKSYSSSYCKIDYEKGIIFIEDDEESASQVAFNGQGYITEVKGSWEEKEEGYQYKGNGKITFSYNKNGQLTSVKGSYNESGSNDAGEKFTYEGSSNADYTWNDGNLTKVESKYTEIEDGEKFEDYYTFTLRYGTQKNELGQFSLALCKAFDLEDYDMFSLVGLFGKASALFPESVREVNHDSEGYEDDETDNVSYDLNEDKTIHVEEINGYGYSYSYTTPVEGRATVKEGKKLSLRSLFVSHRNKK